MEVDTNTPDMFDTEVDENPIEVDDNQIDTDDNIVNETESEQNIKYPVDEAGNQLSNTKYIERNRLLKLPVARVKHIMKMDPDCALVSQDAVLVATKAVELFLAYVGTEMVKFTLNNKRKTVLKRDLEAAIESESRLCFLDGALE